jgi:curved DNA-binding protein CbpA
MTETFYDVLGVTEDATTDEIQSAYRDRLKEVHPDVSDDDDAGETTQRLVEARDVLVDEDERARYDRLGHENYVDGDGSAVAPAAESATQTTESATDTETTDSGGGRREGPRDRGQRERRASQRVRQERAREKASTSTETAADGTTADGAAADSAATEERTDRQGYATNGSTVEAESTYDVRTDVATKRSFGPILPTGHRLTLLAIFFVLYPLLLFSTLLPAFPLFVNVIVGFCALILVGYLQSMPRISLLVFGGWSIVGVTLMLMLGIDVVSLLGFAILGGTVLPFAFSLLTAWALRY